MRNFCIIVHIERYAVASLLSGGYPRSTAAFGINPNLPIANRGLLTPETQGQNK